MTVAMKSGIRVIRGPDWKWDDQDGGAGHVGTVIRAGFHSGHGTVLNGSVFVRWDSGKVANYRITEQHDLRVYNSACAGIHHSAFCDVCSSKAMLGTRWKCSVCHDYDLCDNCYHRDQHDLSHQFLRLDRRTDEGVLVPARKDSVKLEVKGIYPGAVVIRSVEDWILGQSDGGAHGSCGTVIDISESDEEKYGDESVALPVDAESNSSVVDTDENSNEDDENSNEDDEKLQDLPAGDGNSSAVGADENSNEDRKKLQDLLACDETVDTQNKLLDTEIFSTTSRNENIDEDGSKLPDHPTEHPAEKSLEDICNNNCEEEVQKLDDNEGTCLNDRKGSANSQLQAIRRHCSPKDFGCVQVLWDSGNIAEHRRGLDGKVDIFCSDANDTASDGFCYPEHLPVLDCKMMHGNAADNDEESETEGAENTAIISRYRQPAVPFEELLARARSHAESRKIQLLDGNSRFTKGDRVIVNVSPEKFEEMQQEHGGWTDEMALYIGVTGRVLGVQTNGDVVVYYKNLDHKKWVINPDALVKQNFFCGDSVQILSDEAAVRNLQKGHGGWVYPMKEILGKVCEVVEFNSENSEDVIRVKMNKMDWLLNKECCKLVEDVSSTVDANDPAKDSDSSDDEESVSSLWSTLLGLRDPRALRAIPGLSEMGSFLKPNNLVELAAKNELGPAKLILAGHPGKVNLKASSKTALHMASLEGHVDMVKLLLEAGADVTAEDNAGNTPIHYATYKDRADVLELLLEKGDHASVVNFKVRSALHVAVFEHSVQCVEVLLRHNANINAQDEGGNTPLHTAIFISCLDALDMIAARPDFNFKTTNNKRLNVLHLAALNGDVHAVEVILQHGPRELIDIQVDDDDGYTALHIAGRQGHFNVAEILVTQGKPNLDLLSKKSNTPLIVALLHRHASIVELLTAHGADVSVASTAGDTSLHLICSFLKTADVAKNPITDMFDAIETSLIYSELPDTLSVERPWVAMACFLVRHGASLYCTNRAGTTPISLVENSVIRNALLSNVKTVELPSDTLD